MTTIDKIRAEIERLKSKYRHNGLWASSFQSDLAMAKIESMNELLSFLDTLPDEPVSDCHDLEEAAEAYSRQVSRGHNYRDLTCGFIAGAKWQKAKMISALKNDGDLPSEFIDKFHEIDRTAFQNGQVNMREQMMEGAVEGEVQEVYQDDDGIHCCVSVGTDYKPGTIVYVITIPKEEGQ